MFNRRVQRKELEAYLRQPINNWRWDPEITPEENALAKSALHETLKRAKEMLPRTRLVSIGLYDRPLHDCNSNYLRQLLTARRALSEGRWNEACNELVNVIHFYHIEDGRILSTVIGLLEEYLH